MVKSSLLSIRYRLTIACSSSPEDLVPSFGHHWQLHTRSRTYRYTHIIKNKINLKKLYNFIYIGKIRIHQNRKKP